MLLEINSYEKKLLLEILNIQLKSLEQLKGIEKIEKLKKDIENLISKLNTLEE